MKKEIIVVSLISVLLISFFVFTISITFKSCQQDIAAKGGFRQIVVDSGKEVKSIIDDIKTDNNGTDSDQN